LDIGEIFDPDIKAFDHHQDGIDECTFSLLLKQWEEWENAKQVYSWLPAKKSIDISGNKHLLDIYNISYEAFFSLESFLEKDLIQWFQDHKEINKNKKEEKTLFGFLKIIGYRFYRGMERYNKLSKDFEQKHEVNFLNKYGIGENNKNSIPIISYLPNKARYSYHISKLFEKYREKYKFQNYEGWISAFSYDRPKNTIHLTRHGNPDKIDFTRIKNQQRTKFVHSAGFMAVVEKMSEIELIHYILNAIK
jgi:hypothetical protein